MHTCSGTSPVCEHVYAGPHGEEPCTLGVRRKQGHFKAARPMPDGFYPEMRLTRPTSVSSPQFSHLGAKALPQALPSCLFHTQREGKTQGWGGRGGQTEQQTSPHEGLEAPALFCLAFICVSVHLLVHLLSLSPNPTLCPCLPPTPSPDMSKQLTLRGVGTASQRGR